jgi:hypothetical protein
MQAGAKIKMNTGQKPRQDKGMMRKGIKWEGTEKTAKSFSSYQTVSKKGRPSAPFCVCSIGGDEGARTPDLGIANAALSQLSYIPTSFGDAINSHN